MRSETYALRSVRLFRLAIGVTLLLAGLVLLLARGMEWLGLQPHLL
ncbi:hypothetical protein TRP66_10180 [Pseudomonas sp. JDS28PS106]